MKKQTAFAGIFNAPLVIFALFVFLIPKYVFGQLAQFNFPATSSLVVSTKNANVTVSNMSLTNAATIKTNQTTGTYFPNEPYVSGSGGWTAPNQAAAKNFIFTITAASGYSFTITNISFRAYSTASGPSARTPATSNACSPVCCSDLGSMYWRLSRAA